MTVISFLYNNYFLCEYYMSYLEGLSKYTEDLNDQRENFQNMINQHKDRLGDQFQRKFDEITQKYGNDRRSGGSGFDGCSWISKSKRALNPN